MIQKDKEPRNTRKTRKKDKKEKEPFSTWEVDLFLPCLFFVFFVFFVVNRFSSVRSPTDVLGGFADAEAAAELLELIAVVRVRAVQVLALGDQTQRVDARDAEIAQDTCRAGRMASVNWKSP